MRRPRRTAALSWARRRAGAVRERLYHHRLGELRCVPEGAITLWVKVPPGQWSVGPVAGRRRGWATVPVEALRQRALSGARAKRRAVMRVNPEQASKGKSWTPTRPKNGEGSTVSGSSRRTHRDRSIGVMGTARRERESRNRGDPPWTRVVPRHRRLGRWSGRESDRVIVPSKPGNAGGGKDPDFWSRFRSKRGEGDWR